MHGAGVKIDRAVNRELSAQFAKIIAGARIELARVLDEKQIDFISHLAMERAKTTRKKDPPDYVLRIDVRAREAAVQWAKGFTFSANNPAHVSSILRAFGVRLAIQTAKGRTSTKREILEGLAGGHRAIADDGDDSSFLALVVSGDSHAQRRGDRGG